MLLLVFNSFAEDLGSSLHTDTSVRDAYGVLKEAGLLENVYQRITQ
jgi:putative exporter of polyketide antibiotics